MYTYTVTERLKWVGKCLLLEVKGEFEAVHFVGLGQCLALGLDGRLQLVGKRGDVLLQSLQLIVAPLHHLHRLVSLVHRQVSLPPVLHTVCLQAATTNR